MGIAALIMIDLDNLKYINDTYGHDCGDEYIRAAISVLRGVSSSQIITARMSGDGVLYFLPRILFPIYRERLPSGASTMLLPDGTQIRLRASLRSCLVSKVIRIICRTLIKFCRFCNVSGEKQHKGAGIEDFDRKSYKERCLLMLGVRKN